MRHDGMRRENARPGATRTDGGNVASTTAADLKTVAEDMLRMGRHWARAAQGWLERNGSEPQRTTWSRSDRDLQSDYSGDGYDQVVAGQPGTAEFGAAAYGAATREFGGHAQGGRDYGGRDYRGIGPSNYTRSDERILEDVNERLTEAHDLDASGITVEVDGGVATLSGNVPQRWMKHRAEDLADACIGVIDVRNHIQVGDATASTASNRATAGAANSGKANTRSTTGANAGMGSGTAAGMAAGKPGSTREETP